MNRIKTAGITTGLIGVAGLAAYLIIPFEGQTFKAFKDGAGIWTICRGHTKGVYEGMVATQPQCDKWLLEDLAEAEHAYDVRVTFEHHPNVKAASIDFIFNTGAGNFQKSTLRKKLNAGDRYGACAQFPRWHYSGGKDCTDPANDCLGIPRRRQCEKNLCLDNTDYLKYGFTVDNNCIIGLRKPI